MEIGSDGRASSSRGATSPAQLGRDPWGFVDPVVREAAWLDDDLVAVVVSRSGPGGATTCSRSSAGGGSSARRRSRTSGSPACASARAARSSPPVGCQHGPRRRRPAGRPRRHPVSGRPRHHLVAATRPGRRSPRPRRRLRLADRRAGDSVRPASDSSRATSSGDDRDLESGRALRPPDRRAAGDPRARPHARARADRPSRGRDRRDGRVPLGPGRALPRERHPRPCPSTRSTAAPGPGRSRCSSRSRRSRRRARRRGSSSPCRSSARSRSSSPARTSRRSAGSRASPAGEWLAAYALTEPGSGSDSAAMRTTARARRRRVRPGRRQALHHERGGRRPLHRVREDGPGGRTTPGSPASSSRPTRRVSRSGRIEPKMGIKGSTTGEIFLNGCRVPAANLIGAEGEGFKIAMRVLDRSRPGHRRAGARDRPGRDRLRARVREERARRWGSRSRSTSSSPRSSPTWRRSARPRAGSSTASACWPTRAWTGRS